MRKNFWVATVVVALVVGCAPYVAPRSLVAEFPPGDIVVPSGEVVTVYAVVSGGIGPITCFFDWSGPPGTGYGKGAEFTFTPPPGFTGPTQYMVRVRATDGYQVATAEKLVTIGSPPNQSSPPNQPNHQPVANNQSVTAGFNTSVGIVLTGSDPDGNPLTYRVTSNPIHGTLNGTAPNLTYMPNTGYSGSDTVGYVSNDGSLDSNQATVTITVSAAPGQPTTVALSPYPAAGPCPLTVVFAANTSYQTGVSITQYEWDLDGDSTYEQNTGGTPMATHTYTVAGSFTARVRVTDSTGYTASNTVTITVQ